MQEKNQEKVKKKHRSKKIVVKKTIKLSKLGSRKKVITKVKEMIIEDDIKVRKYEVEYWKGIKSNVRSEII